MPPPFEHESFHLALLPNTYFVKQLPSSAELPENIVSLLSEPGFFSITRTSEEISIVGEITSSPQVQSLSGGIGDWRCIKVAGPMEFGKPPYKCEIKLFPVSESASGRDNRRVVYLDYTVEGSWNSRLRRVDLVGPVKKDGSRSTLLTAIPQEHRLHPSSKSQGGTGYGNTPNRWVALHHRPLIQKFT